MATSKTTYAFSVVEASPMAEYIDQQAEAYEGYLGQDKNTSKALREIVRRDMQRDHVDFETLHESEQERLATAIQALEEGVTAETPEVMRVKIDRALEVLNG